MIHKDIKISFEDFRILSLSFSVNPKFEAKGQAIEINPQIAIAKDYNSDKKTLIVRLKVSLITGAVPLFFDVESIGSFSFDVAPDEQTIERSASINCPAIMFPYVRETIADLTRRAGFAPLHLQPINFVKWAERQSTTPQKAVAEKKRSTKKIK